MGVQHIHSEAIKAWADGAEIEVKCARGKWVNTDHPSWDETLFFRVKQYYRVARMCSKTGEKYTTTADTAQEASDLEETARFVEWVSDWVSY